jgi:hypothetical protein
LCGKLGEGELSAPSNEASLYIILGFDNWLVLRLFDSHSSSRFFG